MLVRHGVSPARWPRQRRVKRAFDLALASAALVVLAPAMLAIALIIKSTSRGPVLFRQTRVGEGRQEFVMLKYRTMEAGAQSEPHEQYFEQLMTAAPRDNGATLFKLQADARVNQVGAFLRRWSLDELPQLVNVLRGDMSLVGPRPMLPYELKYLDTETLHRFAMPAGLTGLWQVSGRAKVSPREMLAMDLTYLRHWSLANDILIVMKTLRAVLIERHTH